MDLVKISGEISKKNNWKYFIAGTIFILGAVFFQEYFSRMMSPEKITRKFQVVLQDKEIKTKRELEKLKKLFLSPAFQNGNKLQERYQDIFKQDGLAFFIFKEDSLVYWSENSVPGIGQVKNLQKTAGKSLVLKLQNGWYESVSILDSSETYTGIILLEHCFPFRNEYLKNQLQSQFSVPEGTNILAVNETNRIYSQTGVPILSLGFPKIIHPTPGQFILIFLLFSLGVYSILVFLANVYSQIEEKWPFRSLLFTGFCIDILIIRFVLYYFQIPRVLYNTELFSPILYSSSIIFPSLGDLLINVFLLLFISYTFFRKFQNKLKVPRETDVIRNLTGFLFLGIFLVGFASSLLMVRDLVLNSSFSLNLQNISSLDGYSFIGLFCLATVFLSCFLIAFPFIREFWSEFVRYKQKRRDHEVRITLPLIVIYIILCSLGSSLVLNRYNDLGEKEKRKLIALNLGIGRDLKVEGLFMSQENRIANDSILLISGKGDEQNHEQFHEDILKTLIMKKYFREGWGNYFVQITPCLAHKILRIQPQNYLYDCDTYFQNLISEIGRPTGSEHLFFLDYGNGYKNYLGIFSLKEISGTLNVGKVFIEINSKLVLKDQGYPGLLTDNSKEQIRNISEYSYAFYKDTRLIQRFGTIDFGLDLDSSLYKPRPTARFIDKNGISQFCYPVSNNGMIIISRNNPSFMDMVAPFSYLFIFFSAGSLLFFVFVRLKSLHRISFTRMGERIQIWMIGLLIASFSLVGVLIVLYINKLNTQKGIDNLNERAHSVLIEFQDKFGSFNDLNEQNHELLEEQLIKFSNVFFADVNLYNSQGQLISSSRPEVFEEGLVSNMMNSVAYEQLKASRSFFCVVQEQIGTNKFNSAYIPLFNNHSKLLGYINLPYFAREEKMKYEISSFLVTFINAYAFLILLGIFISLIISYYIAYPLKMLTTRIGHISLGKSNEKINWTRKDEIGKLIEEYNLMVDELEKSAEILIKSEREGAWREMAKQIAHEIKNPLTPMKLSVQYLEKAWNEQAGDWDQRLHRFSQTMIEQIETLSSIASEFSNFAQLPIAKNEPVDIQEVLLNVLELYKNFPNIQYAAVQETTGLMINADKKQLYRVFTNLINNAIQAIENIPVGKVVVSIEQEHQMILVKIADNGIGIPQEQADRVFLPNFTTKSGGMGLGLAIVKNIINEVDGEIGFESQVGKGTIFFIRFYKFSKSYK